MIGDLHNYMKVGILQAASFPETGSGEGPILEALSQIVADVFFGAIEVSPVSDPVVRRIAADLLATSGVLVDFDASGLLVRRKLCLSSLDATSRSRAVEAVKAAVNEAYLFNASRLAVVSGPDSGDQDRPRAMWALVDSIKRIYAYARSQGDLDISLKVADRKIDKKFLIGPTPEAVEVAQLVREEYPGFGLIINLSHLPLLGETAEESLKVAAPYLTRAHIGNCVLKDKTDPLYGDTHPRFGYPGGENSLPELTEFVRRLMEIGYVAAGSRNVVAFEVRPSAGEDSRAVIANSKRVLREAWARS